MTGMTDTRDAYIKSEPKEDEFLFEPGMNYFPNVPQSFGSETLQRGLNHPLNSRLVNQPHAAQQRFQFTSHATGNMDNHYRSVGSHSYMNSNLSSSVINDDELLAFINLDPHSPDRVEGLGTQSLLSDGTNRNFPPSGSGRTMDIGTRELPLGMDRRYQSNPQTSAINGRVNDSVKQHQLPRTTFQQMEQAFSQTETPIGSWQSNNHPLSFRRPDLQGHSSTSQSHSPVTPKTPAAVLGGIPMSAPVNQQLGMPVMRPQFQQAHGLPPQGGAWDEQVGSFNSFVESPLSSPGYSVMHPPMSEMMLKGSKHASLPSARLGVDRNPRNSVVAAQAEQKRKRRRESHNQVERRRRDNINERIQELSHLIPHHRLEDDKVRKHLQSSSPLSPSVLNLNMSPTFANSQLAPNGSRRATVGTITTGIPPEEKEKGPNKGDILNGSVAWTRDLMWCLFNKLEQERILHDTLARHGESWPFQPTEDEARMRAELIEAVRNNGGPVTFTYTRGPDSGLRVPTHTNLDGTPLLDGSGAASAMAVAAAAGFSADMGDGRSPSQQPFWTHDHNMQEDFDLKEEDEYGTMDL